MLSLAPHGPSDEELLRWNQSDKRLVALIPEFDDYLTPEQAALRFAIVEKIELLAVDGAKHLWVGEAATKRVLNEIVRVANPESYPLPETFLLS